MEVVCFLKHKGNTNFTRFKDKEQATFSFTYMFDVLPSIVRKCFKTIYAIQ